MMKKLSAIVALAFFLLWGPVCEAEERSLEYYRDSVEYTDKSYESLRGKFIKLDDMFEGKTAMYQLMTFDGIVYLQLKREILLMLLSMETIRDLSTLCATGHYENKFTGNLDSFYEHSILRALKVLNGAESTFKNMITVAHNEQLVIFIRDVLAENINPDSMFLRNLIR